MSAFTDLLDGAFDASTCPIAGKLYLGHRYVLPGHRAPHYYPQEELSKMTLMYLILATMPGAEQAIDEVSRNCLCNAMLSAGCERPTLFLERELGEILLDSHLPDDLQTSDVKRIFPSFRIMLPRGLLTIERDGEKVSMMHLDIGFLDGGIDVTCPKALAHELDVNSLVRWGARSVDGRLFLSKTKICYDETCILISGSLEKGEDPLCPTAYGITKPWREGPVTALRQWRNSLQSDWPTDQLDQVFLAKMENLALNILILLSRVPLEYEPAHVERKARTEGKRLIPALLRARWVGDCMLRAKNAGHVRGEVGTGRSVSGHWRKAHWVRQACGKGRLERRLIWLLPIHVNAREAA
jgi:hypothetical protein